MGDKIGEGHFGVVYSCKDVWENDLAAKVLKPIGTYENNRSGSGLYSCYFLRMEDGSRIG
jgi:hypothetical protein